MTKCLMIETGDKRKFFTHEKNYPSLIEFSKTFDADLAVVRITDGSTPLMDLAELVPAFCDAAHRQGEVAYEVIEEKMNPNSTKRGKILKTADKIQSHLVETFTSGGVVTLADLRMKFAGYTSACFSNHIRRAIVTLARRSIEIKKIGPGRYQIK